MADSDPKTSNTSNLKTSKIALVPKPRRNRSRGGCTRCRTRRQKCDEQKPECNRCLESGESCSYTISLQWGGRSFKSSSFGSNSEIKKYETEDGAFIYVAASPKTFGLGAPKSPPPALSRSLDALILRNVTERSLLYHFTSEASRITSCHPQIQVDFSQLLIPMALEYPALLSAILALSSIHKTSLYPPQGESNEIITYKTSSIIKLRSDLSQFNERMRNAALATILTLCMCEIHSGADKPRSWRLHLEGAKAFIASDSEETPLTSASSLLRRWYTSIEALAAITAKGLPAGELTPGSASVPDHAETSEQIFLDDYFGFSTDLPAAFKEIGAAAWKRRSTLLQHDAFQSLSELDFKGEADSLEASIQAMIDRDQVSPPKFYPGVEGHLSSDAIHEFRLCNETYQHAALIHIERRVRLEPKESPAVQRSVKRILGCARQIIPKTGLSPWIVLTMPLFTAGREAFGEDRVIVTDLMTRLYESLKLKNIRRSLDLLESSWANDDCPDRAPIQDEEDCDFIPY